MTRCASVPQPSLLSPSSMAHRQVQTRAYETKDELALLSAGVAVLQDMGYSIDETETDLGLLTASKNIEAENSEFFSKPSNIFLAATLAIVAGGVLYSMGKKGSKSKKTKTSALQIGPSVHKPDIDVKQKIRVSIVTSPYKKK